MTKKRKTGNSNEINKNDKHNKPNNHEFLPTVVRLILASVPGAVGYPGQSKSEDNKRGA